MMTKRNFPTLLTVAIGLLVVCAMSFLLIETNGTISDERQELYSAWCKSANRNDITYKEWHRLYRNGLLPVTYIGQSNIKSEIESK